MGALLVVVSGVLMTLGVTLAPEWWARLGIAALWLLGAAIWVDEER